MEQQSVENTKSFHIKVDKVLVCLKLKSGELASHYVYGTSDLKVALCMTLTILGIDSDLVEGVWFECKNNGVIKIYDEKPDFVKDIYAYRNIGLE